MHRPVRSWLLFLLIPALATCGTDPVSTGAAIASISVSPASPLLTALGLTQQFAASARDANGRVLTGKQIAWTSSTPGVASIEESGVATGMSNGSTTIRASAEGVSGTASLTVSQVVTAVEVESGSDTLTAIGDTTTLTAEASDAGGSPVPNASATWTSSAPGIVSVDAAGVATAEANGVATLTARISDIEATYEVSVVQQPSKLAVSQQPTATVLSGVAFTQQPVVQLHDANGNNVEQASVPVTAAISSGAGTLAGTTTGRGSLHGPHDYRPVGGAGIVLHVTLTHRRHIKQRHARVGAGGSR
jgi:hypothetical protein